MTFRLSDGSTIPVVIWKHHWHMNRSARMPSWTRHAFGHPQRPHKTD
jgi:hypothetical protein